MHNLEVKTLRGGKVPVAYDEVPDTCPLCHHSLNPQFVAATYQGEEGGARADLIFQCTRSKCSHAFVGVYRATGRHGGNHHELLRVWPRRAGQAAFSEEVNEVSPTFTKIYQQAMESEAHGLDQLTGIGLRKALEFLVKDFAIHQRRQDEDRIRKLFLGKVIKEFVSDANVKACAARAAWLGNDEAHYTRRWEDRDIADLKRLIRLTANWVDNVLLTEKYVETMPASE